VIGRFPLYTDADVRGPLINALEKAGWDVLRAIDAFPERTPDLTHFERAVALGRVLVSNDEDQEVTADQWYRDGRPFPGVVAWRQKVYAQMTYGEILEWFEELARRESPFAGYPILRIKPR
jgi:Domain of unknown function (DUF5615)